MLLDRVSRTREGNLFLYLKSTELSIGVTQIEDGHSKPDKSGGPKHKCRFRKDLLLNRRAEGK